MLKYLLILFSLFSLLFIIGIAKENMHNNNITSNQNSLSHTSGQTNKTVLVELFTSEGCSSCPPADNVLEELSIKQPIANTEIIVLSEHVDYWNRLGWKDPYSSNEFSLRQSSYAQVFRNSSVYTPQMVINGQDELIGSDKEKALELIKKISSSTYKIKLDSTENIKNSLALTFEVSKTDLAPSSNGVNDVLLAIAEDKLQSSVIKGENAGRKLQHTGVVRNLSVIGEIPSKLTNNKYQISTQVLLSDKWQRNNLKLVAFIQNRKTLQILAASSIRP